MSCSSLPSRRPTVSFGARLRSVLDLSLLTLALWLVLRPSGPLGGEIVRLWQAHRMEAEVEARWAELALAPGLPSLGGGTADPAVIVEFTDYRCPFCAAVQDRVDRVLEGRPDARVVIRHLPLASLHPDAPLLARVAVCSEPSGRFPEVHRALFRTPPGVDRPGLMGLLAAAGVARPEEVMACADGEEARRRVEADVSLARALGVRGTPAFLAPGESAFGVLPAERLREMLGRLDS